MALPVGPPVYIRAGAGPHREDVVTKLMLKVLGKVSCFILNADTVQFSFPPPRSEEGVRLV